MYYKRLLRIALCAVVVLLSSCATTHEIMLADFISFSDDAETSYDYQKGPFKNILKQSHPYYIYNGKYQYSQASMLKDKLSSIAYKSGKNTAGYYALDLGLDRIRWVRTHRLRGDINAKYYIIYFTDGLDNTSAATAKINHQGYYKNLEQYAKKLNKKKERIMGFGKKQPCFQIYPMAYIGEDLQQIGQANKLDSTGLVNWLDSTMQVFRGASKGWEEPEVILASNWENLAFDLADKFTSSSYKFYIPKGYLDKKVRMTIQDVHGNETIIEGIYSKDWTGKYFLKDVKLGGGLTVGQTGNITKLDKVISVNNYEKQSNKSWFELNNLRYNGKNYKVTFAKQDYEEGKMWLYNSEYDNAASAAVDTYLLFISDVSSSLGSDGRTQESKMLLDFFELITKDLKK